jgi:magnesium chelatase family protein
MSHCFGAVMALSSHGFGECWGGKAKPMSFAQVHSCTVWGLKAPAVTVEVHLANGLPQFALVGLADTEVREARERVRSAILNSGLVFPSNKRIIVNLAPADLPKDSGRFDLPIAIGILAASEQIDGQALQHYVFAGELSLSGELRPVRAALAMLLAGRQHLPDLAWVLPAQSAEEAAVLQDARVYQASHLRDVVQALAPAGSAPLQLQAAGWCKQHGLASPTEAASAQGPDLQDVRGQAGPKRALEIAAAGGHSLLMRGPPGSGKSMLAQRMLGLLPAMAPHEALESAAVLSLAGQFQPAMWGKRPYRQPHHSATMAALVGGGAPPRPGEISLAHHGLLFLDELPEFPKMALEALREPLENGRISLSRAKHQAEFPAQFQWIAAMNPCPCGYFGASQATCGCAPDQITRYRARLSGPLLDRIDMQVQVAALSPQELMHAPSGESSAVVQARCQQARERALDRRGVSNHRLSAAQLQALRIDDNAQRYVQQQASQYAWSARTIHRVLRLAQTIADLAQSDQIGLSHAMQAAFFKMPTQA